MSHLPNKALLFGETFFVKRKIVFTVSGTRSELALTLSTVSTPPLTARG